MQDLQRNASVELIIADRYPSVDKSKSASMVESPCWHESTIHKTTLGHRSSRENKIKLLLLCQHGIGDLYVVHVRSESVRRSQGNQVITNYSTASLSQLAYWVEFMGSSDPLWPSNTPATRGVPQLVPWLHTSKRTPLENIVSFSNILSTKVKIFQRHYYTSDSISITHCS